MSAARLDHMGLVVEDLEAAVAFFADLGSRRRAARRSTAPWAQQVTGIDGMRTEIVMMRAPDGSGRLEICRFLSPAATGGRTPPRDEPQELGWRSIMVEVEDLDGGVVGRLRRDHGASLIGEIAQYGQAYRLCYLRGPEGIIVALAEAWTARSRSTPPGPDPATTGAPRSDPAPGPAADAAHARRDP